MPSGPVVPVILAAGASARMGGPPKPLLRFVDKVCLEVVLAVVSRPRAGRPVVVLGNRAEIVRERVPLAAYTVVVNDAWEQGQTGSVQRGLAAVPPDAAGAMIVPVDLPLLTEEDVDRMLAAFSAAGDRCDLFVATHAGRRAHPLLLARRVFAEGMTLGPGDPLHALVRTHPTRVREVPLRNPGILAPMNTPAEYNEVLAEYEARKFGQLRSADD